MVNVNAIIDLWNKITMTDWIWIGAIGLMVLIPLVFWLLKCWHLAHRQGPDHQPPPPAPTYYGSEGHVETEQPKPAKKRWVIPKEHIEEILGLSDKEGNLATYKFWKRVADIFPETLDYNCETDFESDVLEPAIMEVE